MPTFESPSDKMKAAFDYARQLDCHSERLAEVRIEVLAKYATRDKDDEPRGEALLVGGRPALGIIRITTLEERVAGALHSEEKEDVRIVVNGDRWGGLSTGTQRAVFDRCLTQIEVLLEDGRPKLDDSGRPKLRKRVADEVIEVFHEVAERNGKSDIAVQQLRVLMNDHGQVYMPWLDGGDVSTERIAVAPRPKAPKAVGPETVRARGDLKPTRLREAIQVIDRPETILGIVALERTAPRKGVEAALRQRSNELGITPQFIDVLRGDESTMTPDIASAVLVTTTAKKRTPSLLEQLVPECGDPFVLTWIIEDEQDSDDPRDFVIDVVSARVRELGGASTWTH